MPGNVSFAAYPPGLTRREQEVLDLTCAEYRNAQIAAKCSSPLRLSTITSRPCWRNWVLAPVTLPPHTPPGSVWSAPRKIGSTVGKLGNDSRSRTRACRHTVALNSFKSEKETVMNPLRQIRRITAVLAVLAATVLVATPAFAMVPVPGGGGYVAPAAVPAQVQYRTIVVGGMPGWQIVLIAVGTALLAAAVAVLADRARAARRPAVRMAA